MAVIAPVVYHMSPAGKSTTDAGGRPPAIAIIWTPCSSGSSDTCTAAYVGHLQDKSVQIFGDTVTSVAITGSCDGTTYAVLADPQGNALSAINAAKIEAILEHCAFIQPTVTTATNVTFVIFGTVRYS